MAAARKAVDLFLSLGMGASLACSSVGPIPTAQAQHQHHPAVLAEGGEGGEGGEGQPQTVSSDIDLLVVLAQMQGHLRIAKELLSQGKAQAAEPHLGHPADELYGAIEPALLQRGVNGLGASLTALRDQARLKPGAAALIASLTKAQQAITAASQSIPAAVRNDPQTTLAVVRQLAAAAASEYDGAVADGRIVEVIEYQDARGFLLEAAALLQSRAAAPELATAKSRVEAMLKAFPGATPPRAAVLSPQQLLTLKSKL